MLSRSAPLKRRSQTRERTKETPRREFDKHRQFVRGFACVGFKLDGANCQGKIQFCHVRRGTDGGGNQTPSDWWGYPACQHHHLGDQHQHGEITFEIKHGVSLKRIALDLARLTALRDPVFREAMEAARQKTPWLFEIDRSLT